MPTGTFDRMTMEQWAKIAKDCRAYAEASRTAGDLKRAEGFEEGARGADLAIERMRALSIKRSKARHPGFIVPEQGEDR